MPSARRAASPKAVKLRMSSAKERGRRNKKQGGMRRGREERSGKLNNCHYQSIINALG